MANAALDLLEEGSYRYEAIAYIGDDPVASIYDNFSTCKFFYVLHMRRGGGGGVRERKKDTTSTT